MNQRIKVTLAVVGIVAYAAFCVSAVFGHDSQQPHSHASQIVVSTTAFNNIVGITNNAQSNATLQVVLDAMDNSTLPTASNIVVNTNNFGYFAPTSTTLQVLLDWQDDNLITNIQNSNTYMTGEQSSNAFVSTGTTAFIRDQGASVSNKHLGANIIASSNITDSTILIGDIEPGYMKMPRIAGFTSTSISNSGVGSGALSVSLLASTTYTRTTLLYGYFILGDTNVPGGNVTNIDVFVSAWVGPTNGGVFKQVGNWPLNLSYYVGAGYTLNHSTPSSFMFPVPASNYVTFLATAANSNAVENSEWYINWVLHATDATLP